MCSTLKLDKDEKGKSVDEKSNPKESQLTAAKRILQYLIGTQDQYLWYPMDCNFTLTGYLDAEYSGCSVERKSTSGAANFLGPCLISWASKKQNTVSLSNVKSEYVVVAQYCSQILWVRQQLQDYGKGKGKLVYEDDGGSGDNEWTDSLYESLKILELLKKRKGKSLKRKRPDYPVYADVDTKDG
ncbi:secreted RxLR effector protein 161-like [Silene latifolia]|uniref:secreted RxLR effector protein 161-like n=1 Tax=Silene latifolia TaxID=37657 RepID=UPI003D76D1DE